MSFVELKTNLEFKFYGLKLILNTIIIVEFNDDNIFDAILVRPEKDKICTNFTLSLWGRKVISSRQQKINAITNSNIPGRIRNYDITK